jgi:16S rRNA G1207 methylase RsmC
MSAIDQWVVGDAADTELIDGSTGVVALTASELDAARRTSRLAVSLTDALGSAVPRAARITVRVPEYRGMRLLDLLAWLVVDRLAEPDADVTWLLAKQQGPDSVRKRLAGQGWELAKTKAGRLVALRGRPPATGERPVPREFSVDLGARSGVTMAADYGVFSPDKVDDGTALLLAVALREPPVPTVADIGIGYGALSVGLVLGGVAGAAVGTDVDAIALWLADHNARVNGVDLTVALAADPGAVPPTGLTVCNVPTHIPAADTQVFMRGLAERARHGRLLIVVHASLEARYTRHLAGLGHVDRVAGEHHVVLGTRP